MKMINSVTNYGRCFTKITLCLSYLNSKLTSQSQPATFCFKLKKNFKLKVETSENEIVNLTIATINN